MNTRVRTKLQSMKAPTKKNEKIVPFDRTKRKKVVIRGFKAILWTSWLTKQNTWQFTLYSLILEYVIERLREGGMPVDTSLKAWGSIVPPSCRYKSESRPGTIWINSSNDSQE